MKEVGRSFKRKVMEAEVGGGEVRRAHIVYFLSRNGRTEHPHLFRVHHLSRNGVHLTDVKSWLSELRGKDMPQSFAWSYKRRYRGGYVWQDLLDEDLITPICDNEYVLKGSQISSTTDHDDNSNNNKEVCELKKSSTFDTMSIKDPKNPSIPQTLSTIGIEESSFDSNVTTEDTMKDEDAYTDKDEEEVESQADKSKNNSFYEILLNKNTNNSKECEDKDKVTKTPPSPTDSFGKPNRFHMFRNLISCGTANTHDTALVVINKRKISSSPSTLGLGLTSGKVYNVDQTCKEEKSFELKDGSKDSLKAYKPVNGPTCSQCGRQFKPERLHTHMKYCRGMKAWSKPTTTPPPKHKPHTDTFYLKIN